MEIDSLNGDWQLVHFPEGEHRVASPEELRALRLPAIPARVPGNVELDLARAGALPEPFYAGNIRQLRPLETHEWWYSRIFYVPAGADKERWALVFEGLDTLATVWLNGICLGEADNMLVEHSFDATAALRPGEENELVVRIGSALNAARRRDYDAVSMSWERREEGLYIRKAPHVWGWDILPRAVSAGIWRPVRLEPVPDTAIEQLYFYTIAAEPESSMLESRAVIGVRFQFRTPRRDLDGFALRFHGECGNHTFDYQWPVEFLAGGCTIPVPGAQLWWPKGYAGQSPGHDVPALYTVVTDLLYEGEVVATRTERIGIRRLAVERTELAGRPRMLEPAGDERARIDAPPDPQSHFLFTVNGLPIQVRGANWVPLDAFHSRDGERLEAVMALADDLGCNMIRCWGGNVYEPERFFSLCDEKGILVWQDFAFACCRYPQTDEFLDRVRREAEQVVRRLRNHPALAIWCGDNEIDMAYLSEGLSPEQNRITREVLPRVLHRLDPFRAYVPSSPYAPLAVFQSSDPWRATPEQHLWGPRNYYKSPFYLMHSAHFIGEIGYHGCPNVESIRRFISPGQVWPRQEEAPGREDAPGQRNTPGQKNKPWQNNDEWQVHSVYHWQVAPDGSRVIDRDRIQLMANQIQEMFGSIPDDLETFALASQITQAEAKKFFIESTRARKWATSGVLWWNLIDGWPQFSDAVVDYYFSKKLAYHYIWRAQRPVLVMLGEPGSGKYLPVIACNDTRWPAEVRYRVWEADGGAEVAAGQASIPPNQNWQVGRVRTRASDQRLYLIEWETGCQRLGCHYLAGAPPFSLERYRGWLEQIAALPRAFTF